MVIDLRHAVVAFVLVAASAPAAPTAYRPSMTGAQLVRDMQAEPGVGLNSIRRERAMGYIAGVMDATAGRVWCPAGQAIPHELNYSVVEHMARMRPDQLKGDAAPLVLAALAKFFPCNPSGAKP